MPPRLRRLTEQPMMAERAIDHLRTPGALLQLDPTEAALLAAQMQLLTFPAGAVLYREGDHHGPTYMLLLLEGAVSVDTGGSGAVDSVAISVLGAGSIIGEMTLLDGAPRSASCTAIGPVLAAGLSRKGLEALLDEQPRVAAKLMVGLATRMADRLRALGEQIQFYARLAADKQREIERLSGS
jgi:CRP-like cAMP-binding protein